MQIDTGSRNPFADIQSLLGLGQRGAVGVARGETLSPPTTKRSTSEPLRPLGDVYTSDRPVPLARVAPSSIRSLNPSDFEGSLVSRSTSMREETSLSLQLTTREGDVVSLNFQQADFMSTMVDGDRFEGEAGFERLVSLSVVGELSQEELSAIDGMIAKVAEEASSLMEGDLGAAAMRLASMGFESDALSSFALEFRHASYQSMTSVYAAPADQGLSDLACRDCGVAGFLEGIADLQRRLIQDAKSLFADVDAARLGREVVPAVLRFAEQ